jgi:hypothetical protein
MNFKKKVNGSWHDTPHYIHNTSTDTITTLPAVIYPNATTATVGLKGQAVQSGTPTPDSPIMPEGTGERTGNLWDEDYTGIGGTIKYVPVYVGNGSFTLSTSCPIIEGAAALFFIAGNVQSGASTVSNGVYKNRPITVASSDGYVTVAYRYVHYQTGTADPRNEKTMLNSGSTALPYEPYGYKIPILSGGVTTPIYLGETQTTRRIGKIVLNGTESWTKSSLYKGNFWAKIIPTDAKLTDGLCTHAQYESTISQSTFTFGDFSFERGSAGQNNVVDLFIGESTWDATDFQAYLASEYSAGHPVTIYYLLATPQTGTVNEPLMKVGDYADSLTATIPVTAGENTLDVQTTVQPSEVTATYEGWHTGTVHERENGQWE